VSRKFERSISKRIETAILWWCFVPRFVSFRFFFCPVRFPIAFIDLKNRASTFITNFPANRCHCVYPVTHLLTLSHLVLLSFEECISHKQTLPWPCSPQPHIPVLVVITKYNIRIRYWSIRRKCEYCVYDVALNRRKRRKFEIVTKSSRNAKGNLAFPGLDTRKRYSLMYSWRWA
jgi:hypothetical protein